MATSQDEANQENPPETPQQESNPEEEEEEDKNTVRNPRNVVLEPDPLEPFLVRLEHDQKTQEGFFKGMIDFRRTNKEYPFEREEAMEDFINNWLGVRVPWLDFQQTLDRVWRRYVETGSAIGENLNALSPEDRKIFLLQNRILFAYYSERKDKKRKIQEMHGGTSSTKGGKIGGSNAPLDKEPEKGLKQYKEVDMKRKMVDETKHKLKQKKYETNGVTSSSDQGVKIDGSNVPPDKEPEKVLKQYKEVDKKWKIVVDTKQNLKLKLKQTMPEDEEKKVEKPQEEPEEQKRENPPEENPSEEDEEEEAWSEANFETLLSILQSLEDYKFKLSKFPYDDVSDMEDFIKNWVGIDISVSDCLEVIKRLKKNFKKKFWVSIDHRLHFRSAKQEQLYICADVVWNMEALMNSDDEGDEEEEEAQKKDSSDEGGGSLEWEPPDDKKRHEYSEPEYDPRMRPLLPFLMKSAFEQGPGIVPDLMPVDNPVPLEMLRSPIPPVFRFEGGNKQQKAGSRNDSSSVKRYVRRKKRGVQGFQDTKKLDKDQQKVNRTGPQTILRGMPPGPRSQDGKREEMLRRPIPPVPRFHDTKKEDKNQQNADIGEDSCSGNITDPLRTGPQTILKGIPLGPRAQDSKREEMLRRPIPPVPRFQDTKKEDKNQQKVDRGEDSSSGNRTDEEGASGSQGEDPDSEKQCDDSDSEEPRDENPEGGSEAPEEPGGEKIKDIKKQ